MNARQVVRWVSAVVVLVGTSAYAHEYGISGKSGKDPAHDCGDCHSCGIKADCATPTVTFSGPSTLEPGETGTFTFSISGGPGEKFRADAGGVGFDVAASNGAGTLAPLDGDTTVQLLGGEVTHTDKKPYGPNLKQSFGFSFTASETLAPDSGITLYGAGNSVNGNGDNTGDKWNTNTWAITIVAHDAGVPDAGAPVPDAGVDAGTQSNSDGGDATDSPKAGCGCQNGAGGFTLLGLLALVLWTKRR